MKEIEKDVDPIVVYKWIEMAKAKNLQQTDEKKNRKFMSSVE